LKSEVTENREAAEAAELMVATSGDRLKESEVIEQSNMIGLLKADAVAGGA